MLEQKIEEMTKALNRVADALENFSTGAPEEATPAEAPKRRGRPKKTEAVEKTAPDTTADVEEQDSAETEAAATPEPSNVTYDDVAKAITSVARTRGRETTIDFLSRYGVRSGKELKESQWAKVVEHAQRVSEGGDV